MLARTLHDFHQWLFFSAPAVARSIVIEPAPRDPEVLAWAVACELNERCPDDQGRWISFLPDLLEEISRTPCERRLLAIPDRLAGPCSLRNVCAAILRMGYAVLQGSAPLAAAGGLANVFQVSIGGPRTADLRLSHGAVPNGMLPSRITEEFIDWDPAKSDVSPSRADVTNRFGNRSMNPYLSQEDSCSRFSAE